MVIRVVPLLVVNLITIRLMAGEVENPSQPGFSSMFDAVRSEYGNTAADLNTRITSDIYFKRTNADFYPAVHGIQSGKYSFSFYGKNRVCNGNKPFDYGIHKLFMERTIRNAKLSAGIGYDYDGNKDISINEWYKYSNNTITGQYGYLSIDCWEQNSIFGNVNGYMPVEQWKKIAFGIEMIYSLKNGVEYYEESEYTRNSISDSRDDINFFNYDKGSYNYKFKAGAGLMKEYCSRRGNMRLIFADIMYKRNREYSELSVIENVYSSFFKRPPDNIQFSGKDNCLNSIAVGISLSERYPDALCLNVNYRKKIDVNLKSMNVELGMAGIKNKTRSLNQWYIGDTYYYGTAERISTHYPLSLKLNSVSDLHLFQYAHIRLQADIDGILELYQKNKLMGHCILHTVPFIGLSHVLRNKLFIDLNFSMIDIHCGLLGDMNVGLLGFDLLYNYTFQIRISLLKEKATP